MANKKKGLKVVEASLATGLVLMSCGGGGRVRMHIADVSSVDDKSGSGIGLEISRISMVSPVVPGDFDPSKYAITGELVVKLKVEELPPTKRAPK